ncbi:CAP domain-containing protein [Rhodoligotrophos ferricapiens]|uniref:CAP domain-containing protein n=1 Tax=Rhodoligotrophos ferricapiens TaxID=3069264 RepID=UPI00315CA3BA
MMLRILSLVIALCFGLGFGATDSVRAASAYQAYAKKLLSNAPDGVRLRPDLEAFLLKTLNAYRKSQGRPALAGSNAATIAARSQALEMLIGNFVGHQSAGGYRFAQRVEAFVGETRASAENAARDRLPGPADETKARRLFQQWVDSRGHRRNMLSPDYEEVSTGVIEVGNHIYAVQIFWTRRATQDGLAAFRSW